MDNNTTEDTTTGTSSELSPLFRISVGTITAVPVFVNIFYVIVCFKALKKKFHNLLVLMLCIGDSILSLSVTWFSMIKLSDWSATNIHMCLFQIFTVCYGLVYTYSIVFLICYERYLVVKNYNFGVQIFFERFKIVIIGGTVSFGFVFTIETVLFVPHEPTIAGCTVPELYGKQFEFFLTFIAGGLTLIMGGIVFYSLRTSILIWKYFFYKPSSVDVEDDQDKSQNSKSQDDSNLSESCTVTEITDPTNFTEDEKAQYNYKKRATLEKAKIAKQVRELVAKWKAERTQGETSGSPFSKQLIKKTKFKPDAWEKRAFITSLIIVMSTIFLTYPFILSFWLDYFYGARYTSQKARIYLFIPLVLNSVINPFIYAWRIPGIRLAVKNIFVCCRQ